MNGLLIMGVIIVVVGILLIFAPKVLIRIGEVLNQKIDYKKGILTNGKVWGALYILAGLYLFYWSNTMFK